MDNELIKLADAELKQLDVELAEVRAREQRIMRRMTAVRSLLEAYGNEMSTTLVPPLLVNTNTVFAPTVTVTPRENSFKARVIAACVSLLESRGQERTAELVRLLGVEGITFTAADPVATLSAILSKARETFVPDRKNGWSLAKKGPQDAPTSAGLDTNAVSTQSPGEAPRTGNGVQEGDQVV